MADVIERAEDDLEGRRGEGEGSGSRGSEKGQAAGTGPGGKPKKKDRTGLLVALSAAGVVIAYVTYRAIRGGSSTSTAATTGASSATNPANYPASSGTVAGSSYDPNAGAGFDLMLSNLQAQIGALQTQVSAIPTTPTSSSSGTVAPAFKDVPGLSYIQDWESGAGIFQVQNGVAYHLNPQQWAMIRAIDPTAPKRVVQYGTLPGHGPGPRQSTPKGKPLRKVS